MYREAGPDPEGRRLGRSAP